MRIIAGIRRGHKFDGPRDSKTRPTSDLVRESLFNILGDLVDGLLVVDLFAGAGGIGLEALSRGARRAIFVERDRDNVEMIRRNIATLRFEGQAHVMANDTYRWARASLKHIDEPMVVFIDPPYREYENHPERVTKLLTDLIEHMLPGSAIALEAGKTMELDTLPDLDAWDVRRYGGTRIAIRLVGEPAEAAEDLAEIPSIHEASDDLDESD
ncbi:16S rRNA (guanine(966)-N(2))-methyltransferase RsmD [Isosphaeraceae bacterium EP7]